MSESPSVVQGRLGWESGDVSEADPSELEPHPKNRDIYGDTANVDDLSEPFRESVAEKGVLEPLVITGGKQIISGHRRWVAAKAADLDSVPVRYSEFDSDLAEREALIEFNRQREKTPGQLVNEFEEMLEIEKERGRDNQGTRTDTDSNTSTKDLVEVRDAQTRASEKIDADVSGETLRKGKKVKKKAEQGDDTAQEAWEDLKSGDESFHGAYTAVQESGDDSEDTAQENTSSSDDSQDTTDASNDLEVLTSQETDEWSSPREVVEPLDDAVGGFDLDPCSGAESSPFAAATYTEADDGLAQPWPGTVWVNPPYSGVADWVNKAEAAVTDGDADCVVFLCKGDSSTDWWQTAAAAATAVCAVDHRLSFGDGGNSAPFASHIFVFGDGSEELREALSEFGTLLTTGWSR